MKEIKYNIDDLKEMFIRGMLEPNFYTSVNEDGCSVLIRVGKEGFQIDTNQLNGWVRVNEYLYNKEDKSWTVSESYDGRWKD